MTKPKVTVHTTPTQEVIAKAVAEIIVTDNRGRSITLRKPGVLAQFRLVEALGDTSRNEVYMGMVLPVTFVSAIDGDPVSLPGRKSEIEALIQRLDEYGLEAVMTGVQEHFGKADPEGDKAAIKKS